ncbi:MAG: hypothetical protein H6589_06885 [Flavobacteriales bacterium]|nr:hypothetical protein [Flavobacteriales bacterium]
MQNKNNIEQLKKENQFTVPANYFEDLPQQIHARKNQTKSNTIFSTNWYYKILAPTMVVVTLFASYYLYQNNSNTELTPQEISEIIIDQELIQFDEEMIYEVYAETAAQTQTETQDEEIIDYLINDNISINLILEEL